MQITSALARRQPVHDAHTRLLRAVELQQKLRGHLVGRHIIRTVRSRLGVLPQSIFVPALGCIRHRQAVPRKRIAGFLRQDLVEHRNLVHGSIVRAYVPSTAHFAFCPAHIACVSVSKEMAWFLKRWLDS
jgi:hypothetical protein